MKVRSELRAVRLKIFFILILCLSSCFYCFADNQSPAENNVFLENFDWSLQFDFAKNNDHGAEPDSASGDVRFNCVLSGLMNFSTGFQASTYARDFTAEGTIWAFNSIRDFALYGTEGLFKKNPEQDLCWLDFGFKGIYHVIDFKPYVSEHDFLFEPLFLLRGQSWDLKGTCGIGAKFSHLKIVKFNTDDVYLDLYFEGHKFFNSGLELYFTAGNHTYYRYYIMPSPVYCAGVAWNAGTWGRFNLEYTTHLCDQFTTKVYVNGQSLGLGVTLKF